MQSLKQNIFCQLKINHLHNSDPKITLEADLRDDAISNHLNRNLEINDVALNLAT